ncbi:MAG: class I SAM-dependent methyltransferase [Spirochaetaceae bacterium]|jgi:23S rRNA G2069 N7-methylase RlmK/C1962 C5-methylase RlmI|nr:class I SAM-dependent methyltransferase [Spirochaetaceae bacterium]
MIENETVPSADLAQTARDTRRQAEMFFNRLRKRQRHLRKWAARTGAGVYRLYDRDIPEIPLALDFYHNDKIQTVSGALYKRPYEKDPDEEERWLCAMKSAAAEALGTGGQNIFFKLRRRQKHRPPRHENRYDIPKTGTQYQKEPGGGFEMVIKENGLSFIVNLSEYIDTGIFPDLRLLRKMIMAEASGKTVLNLFCYTGSFSVYAAKGGARRVDSVDMSSTYLKWALRNGALNGVEIQPERSDVFRFLDRAESAGKRWDIIIADPPAFSNSKRMKGNPTGGVFDIKRDYQLLISKCIGLLSGRGRLFFCVNAHVSREKFNLKIDGLGDSFKSMGTGKNISIKDISEQIRDEDFRDRRMPLCYVITT